MASPEMQGFLNKVAELASSALQQNETIDLFKDEFEQLKVGYEG